MSVGMITRQRMFASKEECDPTDVVNIRKEYLPVPHEIVRRLT